MAALIPLFLAVLNAGATLAPELIQEIKDLISNLDPNSPAVTPEQEAAAFALVQKIGAQIQAG